MATIDTVLFAAYLQEDTDAICSRLRLVGAANIRVSEPGFIYADVDVNELAASTLHELGTWQVEPSKEHARVFRFQDIADTCAVLVQRLAALSAEERGVLCAQRLGLDEHVLERLQNEADECRQAAWAYIRDDAP